jgi:DNA-binding transcriptional LysR family regulator
MDFQHLSKFELRQICYFMALVQAGNNFTEAAKLLGIAQPPLSQRIKALEELLSAGQEPFEVKLFERSKRPIVLTEAGQVFLIEAEQALIHLDRAILRARQASKGYTGRLVLGVTDVISNSILPEVIQKFQQKFPDVLLEIRDVPFTQQTMQLLKNHQIDVTFQQSFSLDYTDPALVFQPILQEYFILALPSNHRLAGQAKIALTDLQNEPIILPSFDILPFYEKVVSRLRELGFEPKMVESVTAAGAVSLLSLVAAGVGVSILPNHVQTLRREGVVYRPIHNAGLTREVSAVWRQDDSSIVLRQFLQVIQELMNLSPLDSW